MRLLIATVIGCLLLTGCANDILLTARADSAFIKQYSRDANARIFTIKGAVYFPGRYRIETGEKLTLYEALARAGGIIKGNYFAGERCATLHHMRVQRLVGNRYVLYQLSPVPRSGDQNFLIQPGDVIWVAELA